MGMVANLLRVSSPELEAYLEDSSLLEERVYDEESDDDDPALAYLDKAWDGVIFLLTGQNSIKTTHPLGKLLFSGQVIDEEQDMGYGPAYYLKPDQVLELHTLISGISVEDLKQNYDAAKMNKLEVYPGFWKQNDELFEYLAEAFITIQNTYADAVKNKEGIITFIN